ncbi:hypothetical protein SLS62_008301 [Diatrype stigma]|uniref:Isochorismatase-like domain-containing protein n=1 Tax=Diatrype stigma TaxID=117547 RepID=A0AAN9YNT0_9PEZI
MADKATPERRIKNQAIFVCDLQDKFRPAIFGFDLVLRTTQKVLRAAKILNIPVYVTTQNAARLGGPVPELEAPLAETGATIIDKTRFSMWVPELAQHFSANHHHPNDNDNDDDGDFSSAPETQVVIVGIEAHICVTQTAMDLLAAGHDVYVLADGVSSCNEPEVPLALARLRGEGATVTTSEGWLYETLGDAAAAEFRDVARLVKETGPDTKLVLSQLPGTRTAGGGSKI